MTISEVIKNEMMELLDRRVGKLSRADYREVLEGVSASLQIRLDCLDEEERESE